MKKKTTHFACGMKKRGGAHHAPSFLGIGVQRRNKKRFMKHTTDRLMDEDGLVETTHAFGYTNPKAV